TTSPSPDKPAVRTTASPIPEATRRSFAGQPLVIAFVGLTYFCVQALRLLIPDKSGDLLAWWIAILEHRRHTAKKPERRPQAGETIRTGHRGRREEGDDPL
ncbi:hypothetical protein ACFY9R_22735, partial [Streptomyces albidoflavus]